MITATQVACWPIPRKASDSIGIAIIKAARRGVLVPKWVPERLVAEYVDSALEYGEEHAALHISKIKRELSI